MMNRKELAKLVVRDLKTLEFTSDHIDGEIVYRIIHPDNKYSLWTANGYWFTAIETVMGRRIDSTAEGYFGLLIRIKVWWHTLDQISRLKAKHRANQLAPLK